MQLALDLRTMPGWGGRRVGAGRKHGPHPRVRHLSRPAIGRDQPCHVTWRVRQGVPSLRKQRFVAAFESTLRAGCERDGFRVVVYSIQRDHVHAIVEAYDAPALGRGMKSFGTRLALAAKRVFGWTGRILQDRYHLHVLRTPREVRNALVYVLQNARKHARALGLRIVHAIDPASSGRWFAGWHEPLPAAHDPPAVAEPRSWLLRAGWLRHGRIGLTVLASG